MWCARETTLTFSVIYLSPLTSKFWLTFFQSYILPLFFTRLLSYLVGAKRRTSGHLGCKRDNSHFFCYVP